MRGKVTSTSGSCGTVSFLFLILCRLEVILNVDEQLPLTCYRRAIVSWFFLSRPAISFPTPYLRRDIIISCSFSSAAMSFPLLFCCSGEMNSCKVSSLICWWWKGVARVFFSVVRAEHAAYFLSLIRGTHEE